jgi:DNA polymerase-3 subunit epsilon
VSLLGGQRVVVIDTETTGFDPAYGHRIVEIALVAMADGELGETWHSLVNPGRPIPPDAVSVHGIRDEDVADAPRAAVIAAEVRGRCGAHPLVFHNAGFDLPFIAAMLREGRQAPLWNPVVDTLGLARGLGLGDSHALDALAERLGLPRPAAHRALNDATTTARLFAALAARWQERGVRSLAELAAMSQDLMRPGARRPAA